MSANRKIVIIGAGPTGLGAAVRLKELNDPNYTYNIIEKSGVFGGLSATEVDPEGFLWDMGGHITFSHYDYFDDVLSHSVAEWLEHERESWIWAKNRFIPYPFQNNIRRLPKEDVLSCLLSLIDSQQLFAHWEGFDQWLLGNFGQGIYDIFMKPYNEKVWGCPLRLMSTEWMGERVSPVDIKRVLTNIILEQDDLGWGPNSKFRFPLNGGTGAIWKNIGKSIKPVVVGREALSIDVDNKKIEVYDGVIQDIIVMGYDHLISTMPLDKLISILKMKDKNTLDDLKESSKGLVKSTTHVVGLGIKGEPPEHLKTKCWMYFPEDNCPFYRVTIFSNYSHKKAPAGHWSIMMEVSETEHKSVEGGLIQSCLDGAMATKLIDKDSEIVSKYHKTLPYGYPIPTHSRDCLEDIQPVLEGYNILSRGRFGGWKYEVGNMDHSFMQGVEAVDHIIYGTEELTYYKPDVANNGDGNRGKHFTP